MNLVRLLRNSLTATMIMGCALSIVVSTAGSAQATAPSKPQGTASGLPWQSGAFSMEDGSLGNDFSTQRNANLDVWSSFSGSKSKTDEASMWMLSRVPSNFHGTALSIGVPLWPHSGSSVTDAATGGMDDTWTSIALGLKSKYPDSYIRLGWEMNYANSDGGVATESNKAEWVAAFQRASRLFKRINPRFKIVFNPNIGPSSDGAGLADATEVYPGDSYVDVIGLDVYDQWEPFTSDNSWQWHYAGHDGLNYWVQFSYAHDKPFALPEWGLSSGDYHHGNDNPQFIDYMYSYLLANKSHIAYESYYDDFGPAIGSGMSATVNQNSMTTYNNWIYRLKHVGVS